MVGQSRGEAFKVTKLKMVVGTKTVLIMEMVTKLVKVIVGGWNSTAFWVSVVI